MQAVGEIERLLGDAETARLTGNCARRDSLMSTARERIDTARSHLRRPRKG